MLRLVFYADHLRHTSIRHSCGCHGLSTAQVLQMLLKSQFAAHSALWSTMRLATVDNMRNSNQEVSLCISYGVLTLSSCARNIALLAHAAGLCSC